MSFLEAKARALAEAVAAFKHLAIDARGSGTHHDMELLEARMHALAASDLLYYPGTMADFHIYGCNFLLKSKRCCNIQFLTDNQFLADKSALVLTQHKRIAPQVLPFVLHRAQEFSSCRNLGRAYVRDSSVHEVCRDLR